MAGQPVERTPSMNSRLVMLGTIMVIIIGIGAILYIASNQSGQPATNPVNGGAAIVEGDTFDGVQAIDPPRQVQAFTLTDQNNKPFSLSDLRGKMVLMFFGYTHCPEECPKTMLEFKKIKAALGDQAKGVAFVFVSVDGVRDTPDAMKKYVNGFDQDFIGLTGDEATIKHIGSDYDLYFEHESDANGTAGSYLVTHTSNAFLIDRQGRMVALYLYGTETDVVVKDIRSRLNS